MVNVAQTQVNRMYQPMHTGVPQFRGKPAKSFELLYGPYADLMIDYSKGIPDSYFTKHPPICLIRIEYIHLRRSTEDTYAELLKKGYPVELVVRPKRIDEIIRSSEMAEAFERLEERLDQKYTHVAKINEGAQATDPELASLLARKAMPWETVKLLVLTNDSDRLAEELTKRISQRNRSVPYVLVTGSAKTPLHVWPAQYFKNQEQSKFIPSTLLSLTKEKSRDYFIMNTPSGREIRRLTPDSSMQEQKHFKQYLQDIAMVRKQIGAISNHRMRNAALYPSDSYAEHKLYEDGWDGFFWNVGLSPSSGLGEDIGKNMEGFGHFLARATGLDKLLYELQMRQVFSGISFSEIMGMGDLEGDVDRIIRDVKNRRMLLDNTVEHWKNQLDHFESFQIKGGRTNIQFQMGRAEDMDRRRFLASTFHINALPGEILTSPVEDSVNGTVYFAQPFYFRGTTFRGLELGIKDGAVIRLSLDGAKRSRSVRQKEEQLKCWIIEGHDPKQTISGLNRIGEFAIGFNRELNQALKGIPVKDPLLAEKQGIHFALGASYQEAGGKNICGEHLDLSLGNDEEVTITGTRTGYLPVAVYSHGKFTPEFLNYRNFPNATSLKTRSLVMPTV